MSNIPKAVFDPKAFLATVGAGGSVKNWNKGQVIYFQRDQADALFFIQKGKVKVTTLSSEGKEAVVAIVGEGNFFGEGCLAGQLRRISTKTAITDWLLSRLDKATVVRLLHDRPDFAAMFIKYLLARNIRMEANLIDQLFNSSEKRLARLLLLLANFGREGKPQPIFASGGGARAGDLLDLQKDPRQWVSPTGDYANLRHSALKPITTENVRKLVVDWQFSTGVLRGQEGAPLVIREVEIPAATKDGAVVKKAYTTDVMYLHTPFPNVVYALDLKGPDHKVLWKYAPQQDSSVVPVMCCDTVNRGLAYGDGKIFLARADTTLVALDAATGASAGESKDKPIWSVKFGDPSKGETSTAAPHVFRDKVLLGNAGGEFGVRGQISAYDIKTRALIWRGYSTGPDSDMLIDPEKTTHLGRPVGKDSGINTWQGEQWKFGGGTAWGWYSYDPELNLIYYGTGNPSTWNPAQRPGDIRWSLTLWARDLDAGKARWVYQTTPHDQWDYDAVNEIALVDQEIGGKKVNTAVHFDRNGFGYTLDRTNGDLLVAQKFDPAVNWATKIDMDKTSKTYGRPLVDEKFSPEKNGEDVTTQGACPTTLGSKDQQPSSYDPNTGLFLVPTNQSAWISSRFA